MECGAENLACQFIEILRENDFATGVLARYLGQLGDQASGIIGWISWLLREHGEKIVALLGFSFGFYRWWLYREHILHKRLQKYLKSSDERLVRAHDDVLNCLQRPGPRQAVPALPLFADKELRAVLRERRWGHAPVAASVEASTRWQLERAAEKIERRLQAGEEMISSLRSQLAATHLMRGAIAASDRRESHHQESGHVALNAFRSALQVPGHEQNVRAKEYEAHQLRLVGDLASALTAYRELEQIAASSGDYRTQRLTIARAKRYQAEVLFAQQGYTDEHGHAQFRKVGLAWALLRPEANDSVLAIRSNFAPYRDWDLIEQGDIHYLTALIANVHGFVQIEPRQIDKAEACYENALTQKLPRGWRKSDQKKLRAAAAAGLDRVVAARDGDYAGHWLAVAQRRRRNTPTV